MSAQHNRDYYLDKIGIARWQYRKRQFNTSRFLFFLDEMIISEKSARLLKAICQSVGLLKDKVTILNNATESSHLKSYLARHTGCIILGEALSKTIRESALTHSPEILYIKHRLTEGLDEKEKRDIYLFLSGWVRQGAYEKKA